jgi:hypothetical protein
LCCIFYLHPLSLLFLFVSSKGSKHVWLFSYMTHVFYFSFNFTRKWMTNYKSTNLTWKQIIELMLAHNFSLWFTQKSKHSKLTQKWKQKFIGKQKHVNLVMCVFAMSTTIQHETSLIPSLVAILTFVPNWNAM